MGTGGRLTSELSWGTFFDQSRAVASLARKSTSMFLLISHVSWRLALTISNSADSFTPRVDLDRHCLRIQLGAAQPLRWLYLSRASRYPGPPAPRSELKHRSCPDHSRTPHLSRGSRGC